MSHSTKTLIHLQESVLLAKGQGTASAVVSGWDLGQRDPAI